MPCRKYVNSIDFASSSFVRRRPNIYCKAVSHSRCKRVFTIHDCLEPTTSLPRPPPRKEHSFEIKTSTKTHGLHVVACSNARRYMHNYLAVLSGSTEDAPTSMYMYVWYTFTKGWAMPLTLFGHVCSYLRTSEMVMDCWGPEKTAAMLTELSL